MLRATAMPIANALLGATVDDTLACISKCPLDEVTLQPSPSSLVSIACHALVALGLYQKIIKKIRLNWQSLEEQREVKKRT